VRTDQVTQVRGYADQMLRVKSNPTDPSNRRVSILVKNDNETVPTVSAAKVVDGSMTLPGPHRKAALRQTHKKERRVSLRRRARQKWARRRRRDCPASSCFRAGTGIGQAAAGTLAAKPGLLQRLKAMLPGGKN